MPGPSHPPARVLALDLGECRTGIALSDPSATLATPLETVRLRPAALLQHIVNLTRDHDVKVVVIGVPLRPSGEQGGIASLAGYIAAELRARLSVEVVLWDETLTTWEAEQRLRETKAKGPRAAARRGRPRRAASRDAKGEIDRMAAAVILQDYLDTRRREGSERGER
ncbi:MAG: Holliday junction resolvase RuvX [Candidatus Eisenbacteria bacterium]